MRTVPGPYCTAACCGSPRRKSAKSSPTPLVGTDPPETPDAYRPVNTNEPRGLLSVRLCESSRRKSPPRRSMWRAIGRVQAYASESRSSVRRDGVTSRRLERLENDNCGTPQSNGSVATPVMPAAPATSSTYGVLIQRSRVRARVVDVDAVARPAALNVERHGDGEARAGVLSAEGRKHVGLIVLVAAVLKLRRHVDAEALPLAAAAAAAGGSGSTAPAAATPAGPAAAPGGRREVVRDAQVHAVGHRSVRRHVVEIAAWCRRDSEAGGSAGATTHPRRFWMTGSGCRQTAGR